MKIEIRYEGVDISKDVIFSDATFQALANGRPGPCNFRVKDLGHTYEPGYFHIGGKLELFVYESGLASDDDREWDGWVFNVRRGYAFDVDDTINPYATPRYWIIEGSDRNFLFTRRVIMNKAKPADPAGVPTFQPGTPDDVALKYMLHNFLELDGDEVDIESEIRSIGTPGTWEIFKLGSIGDPWMSMMDDLVGQTGAIYFIDPVLRALVYGDDVTATAPFTLSDVPVLNEVGYRDMDIRSDGMSGPLSTDALVWGVGKGSDDPVFARSTDAEAVAKYGLWQWGDIYPSTSKRVTAQHRADTYLQGSPSHRRGHVEPQDFVSCTIFRKGIRCGQKVHFKSLIFDWQDILPVRSVVITFPTPHDVKWDLMLSHSIDVPFAAVDPRTTPPTSHETPPGKDIIHETIGAHGWWMIGGDSWPVIGETGFPWEIEWQSGLPYVASYADRAWDLNEFAGGESIECGRTAFPTATSAVYANIPWPLAGLPAGAGGWAGSNYTECWYEIPNLGDAVSRKNIWAYIPEIRIQGSAPALAVGIAHLDDRDPQESDLHAWSLITVIPTVTNAIETIGSGHSPVDEAAAATPIVVLIQGGQIDPNMRNFIVISPWWRCGIYPAPGIPDISYRNGSSDPCAFHGPICSGEGGSGQAFLPNSLQIKTTASSQWEEWHAGTGTTSLISKNVYQTTCPYVPGSLEVWVNGQRLMPGKDFFETDPEHGLFSIPSDQDDEMDLQVTYRRTQGSTCGGVVTNPDGTTVPPAVGVPHPGEPVPQGGKVYRPVHQSQFGWGTEWDGCNCNMASAAMALDRHTMGRYSPTNGTPESTAPNMRYYSGNYAACPDGTSTSDAMAAWSTGWQEPLYAPGVTSWNFFLEHIQRRGAGVSGLYSSLEGTGFKSSDSFGGSHRVYVNEQFPDGSFLVYDPITHHSRVWPHDVLMNYAFSMYGDGTVNAFYTRATPAP